MRVAVNNTKSKDDEIRELTEHLYKKWTAKKQTDERKFSSGSISDTDESVRPLSKPSIREELKNSL